jgi:hypothetical protein
MIMTAETVRRTSRDSRAVEAASRDSEDNE